MPTARPLPKKFMTCLEEAQDQRDIEAGAYRVAFELSELEIADTCDECPAAPPQTAAQVHLVLLADELERQAALARQRAGMH